MALSLSHSDSQRLNRALDSWQDWNAPINARPVALQELGGDSNSTILVESSGRHFVIRLDGDSSHLGVDRTIERTILDDIKGQWFAPPLVHSAAGFLVMNHIRGHRGQLAPGDLAELLLAIHATETRVAEELDLRAHIRGYEAQLTLPDARLPALVERVLALPIEYTTPRLCHVDLIPDNIIVANDRAIVIDWEYARLCQPAYDVAAVIEGHRLTLADASTLMSAYDIEPEAVRPMQCMYRLAEGLWWEIKGRPSPAVWDRLGTLLRSSQ